jgi:hypothetical protein
MMIVVGMIDMLLITITIIIIIINVVYGGRAERL